MTHLTTTDYELTHLNFDAQEQADVISAGQHYFYRYGSVLRDISHAEFEQIIKNPRLYYFSTALKIHQRLKRLHAAYQLIVQPHLDRDPLAAQPLPYKYLISGEDEQGQGIDYEIVRIRIRQSSTDPQLKGQVLDSVSDSTVQTELIPAETSSYWAEVIRAEEQFFYRIGNTLIDISKDEYCRVIENPNLYYFFTALYLHQRIGRINKIKAAVPN